MSLIPHTFFPRSMFNMDQWFGPSTTPSSSLGTLDVFDPFDELDNMMSRNLWWLNRPDFMQPLQPMLPRIPQKYRVTVDCPGFKPDSIRTDVQNNQLIVSGKEEERVPNSNDYTVHDFRKTYTLPENVQTDKLVSFMTPNNQLVIEFPLKDTKELPSSDLFPKVIENKDGSKSLSMNFSLPPNIDPTKVHVSVKDRDLIVRAEHKVDKQDSRTRLHYYQRTTLPENTNFDQLKCVYDKNQIKVNAPIDIKPHHSFRSIPIEQRSAIKQS